MNSDAPPKEGQKAQRGAFRGALRGFEGRPSKEGRVGQSGSMLYLISRDMRIMLYLISRDMRIMLYLISRDMRIMLYLISRCGTDLRFSRRYRNYHKY